MAIHTLRGTLTNTEKRRLIVDDGQFTQAHRVKAFYIFPVDLSSGAADVQGVLAIDEDGLQVNWRADDNRQIGWSSTTMSTSNALNNFTSIIDPDHIIVRDLWVTASSGSGDINFMVELEPVTITEDHAVLALLKEVSQDV